MNRLPGLITALLIATCLSCERVEYYPDKPINWTKTNIIAHQGGGNYERGNTFEACQFGLKMADGIEVDIQKTADNDLWLSHPSQTEPCGSFGAKCFASIESSTLIEIDSCLGNSFDFTRLEKVFDYLSKNYPDKHISLDVKAWKPCGVSRLNILYEMKQMAKEIIALTKKYHLEQNVLVESEVGDFLYYIKTHSNIETYLAVLGDYELGISRALDDGFSGISFHYKFDEPLTKEQVAVLHRKGLKIQLWTVNEIADLEEARLLLPDYIQTDNF